LAVSSAKREWEVILGKWRVEASVASFDKLRLDMATAKNLYEDLPNERLRKLAKLRNEHRQFQEKAFLDRFRIDSAKIRGIGPGRAAALASFGIETAHDVSERAILAISGFGPSLVHELVSWRQEKQRRFVYNPNAPIAPTEINRVESEILASRKHCIETLRQGQTRLARLSREIPAARERLRPPLLAAWNALRVAEEMQARV
jgi:DNA-binding helix-hairpin-helix protein with protein kinase domain